MQENLQPDDEMIYKINWLKTSNHPWQTLEEYWNDTFPVRKHDRSESGPAQELLKKWPSFKHKLGYTLVSKQNFLYIIILVGIINFISN